MEYQFISYYFWLFPITLWFSGNYLWKYGIILKYRAQILSIILSFSVTQISIDILSFVFEILKTYFRICPWKHLRLKSHLEWYSILHYFVFWILPSIFPLLVFVSNLFEIQITKVHQGWMFAIDASERSLNREVIDVTRSDG